MIYNPVFKTNTGKMEILRVYDSILTRWPVSYEEHLVETRCGSTYTLACGDNSLPPLVLLHGTCSNSSMWIGEIEPLSKYFRVYALDMPGEPGKSEERQYALKSPAYLEWLEEAFQQLGLKEAVLIGLSLGGWAALNFAVNHPESVTKLVLISPSGIGPQKFSFVLKSLPLMLQGEKGLDRLSKLVSGKDDIPEEALEYSKLIAKHFNLRFESVPIFTDDQMKRLTMPILLLAGEKDILLNSKKTAQRMARLLPEAQVSLIKGAGHILTHLHPQMIPFLTDAESLK